MGLDVAAVARFTEGEWLAHGRSDRTPVDGIAPIREVVVVGNPDFATLVTGSEADLGAGLGDPERRAALRSAVFVGTEHGPSLRRMLAEHGMAAIIGARGARGELHARLAALLAEAQAADDRLVTAGTKVLTQVARRGGAESVIVELARRIDGWAVLLDADGHLIASAGAGRLHIQDAVAVAFGRPVKVRHHGLQTHQVGSDRDRAGYLVIASRSSVTSRNRDLASQAAALFDLVLRTRDPSVTERLGRQALLETLLAGGSSAIGLLARWGVRDETLTAFEVGSRTRTVDLERAVTRWLDELGVEHVFAEEHGRVRGFLPDVAVADFADRVSALAPSDAGHVHLGIGQAAPTDALGRSSTQAGQALAAALDDGRRVVRFGELPTVGYVLDALDAERVHRLPSVLDALRDESGQHGALTDTLRVFLAAHGGHRASAAQLGIHRQTLGARLRRIETLTGLALDRADDRAAAWLALRALGR